MNCGNTNLSEHTILALVINRKNFMTLTGFELLAQLFKLPLPLRGSYLYLNFNTLHNREKKSLRHVATVTKFLAENKAKVNYDTVTNFIDLSQLHLICQLLTKFSGYLF